VTHQPKNEIWATKSVWFYDISIDWEFHKFYMEQEKYWGQKSENKPSEPKNGNLQQQQQATTKVL
jgi:hypothetical protein